MCRFQKTNDTIILLGSPKSLLTGKCKPKHFECMPGECIPSPWVCDGEEVCYTYVNNRINIISLK